MTTVASSSRPARSPAKRDWSTQIKTKGSGLPSRLIIHGVEGVGKTSIAANAPNPIFLMARGETGLETLIDSGRLEEVPHFPESMNFSDVIGALEWLRDNDHEYKTVVIDTLNGLERLCHEFVCKRDFANDWGSRGFTSYMTGFEISLADWRLLLNLLDEIREKRAEKEFVIGRYYERTAHLSSAIYYYKTVRTRWPDSVAATKATVRLELLGLLQPAGDQSEVSTAHRPEGSNR